MKTKFLYFILLMTVRSMPLFCQDVTITLSLSDTLSITPGDEYAYIFMKISNLSEDTLYLPGFKVAVAEHPDKVIYVAYYSELRKQKRTLGMVNPDSILLNEKITPTGLLILFVRKDGTDSLVEFKKYCHERDYLRDEYLANYDSTQIRNPFKLNPYEFFSYERMLILPPLSSQEYRIYCDFRCFDLKRNINYKFFILYSFNYKLMKELNCFNEMTDKLNFVKSSIKSTEINLIRGYFIQGGKIYYEDIED